MNRDYKYNNIESNNGEDDFPRISSTRRSSINHEVVNNHEMKNDEYYVDDISDCNNSDEDDEDDGDVHNIKTKEEDLDELGISLLSEIFPEASREELEEVHFQRVETLSKSKQDGSSSSIDDGEYYRSLDGSVVDDQSQLKPTYESCKDQNGQSDNDRLPSSSSSPLYHEMYFDSGTSNKTKDDPINNITRHETHHIPSTKAFRKSDDLPLASNLGRRIFNQMKQSSPSIDTTSKRYSKLKDCLTDDFLLIPSNITSIQAASTKGKVSSSMYYQTSPRTIHKEAIRSQTNIDKVRINRASSNNTSLQNDQVIQFEHQIKEVMQSLKSSLLSSSSTTPSDQCIDPNYKLWTIQLHRDMYVGFGLQIHELHGCIYVNALICPNGKKITSIDDYNRIVKYQNSKKQLQQTQQQQEQQQQQYTYQQKNGDDNDYGPAFRAGIKPGDCILGVNGILFDSLQYDENNVNNSSHISQSSPSISPSHLLANAAKLIADTIDPIVIHVIRMKDGSSVADSVVHIDNASTMNYTSNGNDRHGNDVKYGRSNNKNNDNNTWQHIDDIPSFSINQTSTSPTIVHPLALLLTKSQIIKPGDENKISALLGFYTKRACLWPSNYYLKEVADSVVGDTSSQTSSFQNRWNNGGSMEKLKEFISKRDVYPGFIDLHSRHQRLLKQQYQPIMNGFDSSYWDNAISNIRQALCIHIVNTFVDRDRLAFTIWVYDVESGCEWYAPVRYVQDFHDLRSAVSSLHKGLERLPFPNISRWIHESDIVSSQSLKESRCSELESFLRELSSMIYKEDLVQATSMVEIALYIQTFLGCDSQLTSSNDMVVEDFAHYQDLDSKEILKKSEQMLHRSVQLYIFRVFLVPEINCLVSQFKSGVIKNAISFDKNRTVSKTSGEVEKQTILSELARINHFYSSLSKLIYDGCVKDFDLMSKKGSFITSMEETDVIYKNAVREQIEIHAYVPLRSIISGLLVFGWRYDDKEIYFKKQGLKGKSQTFFNIKHSHQSPSQWKSAVDILTMGVGQSTLPCNKLHAIVKSGKAISKLRKVECSENDEPWGADDFLPIFIYCVVQAEIERPCALSVLLRSLCDETQLLGEIGYYLSSFEAAIAYIHEIDLSGVG